MQLMAACHREDTFDIALTDVNFTKGERGSSNKLMIVNTRFNEAKVLASRYTEASLKIR